MIFTVLNTVAKNHNLTEIIARTYVVIPQDNPNDAKEFQISNPERVLIKALNHRYITAQEYGKHLETLKSLEAKGSQIFFIKKHLNDKASVWSASKVAKYNKEEALRLEILKENKIPKVHENNN
jgi:hypothetical protein